MNIYAKFGSETQKSDCTAKTFIYWLGYMCSPARLGYRRRPGLVHLFNRPGVAGGFLQTPLSLINKWVIITLKPLELGSWNFDTMFITLCVSRVTFRDQKNKIWLLAKKNSMEKWLQNTMTFRENLNCDKIAKNCFERELWISGNQILAPAATSWFLQKYYHSCSHILTHVATYWHLGLYI